MNCSLSLKTWDLKNNQYHEFGSLDNLEFRPNLSLHYQFQMCDAICKKEKCFQSWIASIAVITDYQLPVDTGMKYQVKLFLQLICWKRKIIKFPSGVTSSWLKLFLFNYKESSFGSHCIPLWVDEFLQCQPGKRVKDFFPSCASRGEWKGSEYLCVIRSVEKVESI